MEVFHWVNYIHLYFRPFTFGFGVGNLTDACMCTIEKL